MGANTIITEGVEEAMTKGKINGGTMAGPRSRARPRTRQGSALKKQKNCTIVNAYKTTLGLEDWVREVTRPQGSYKILK